MRARNRAAGEGRVRITGGRNRGRALAVGPGVRPTEARLREALFSIWGQLVPGSRFLDLFAGSGGVGLEAWSRGAAEVCLVEANPEVAHALESNVERAGGEGCRVLRAEIPAGFDRLCGQHFDLIFADPPYAFDAYGQVLAGGGGLLDEQGAMAVEHSRRRELPPTAGGLTLTDQRSYGDKTLSFYR